MNLSWLAGWWEYALALTLGCGVFMAGSGWFAFGMCGCFLLACRRKRTGASGLSSSGSTSNTSLLYAKRDA